MSSTVINIVPAGKAAVGGNGSSNGAHRELKISVLRYNPQDPASVPHMQTTISRKPTA